MVETLLDVNGILEATQCSYNLSMGILSKIGKKAADLYMATYGHKPDKQPAEVYGRTYEVYRYREEDRWMVYQAAAVVLADDYRQTTGCQTEQFNTLLDRLHKLLPHCSGQTEVIINKLLEKSEKKWHSDANALLVSTGMVSKCAKVLIAQQEAKRAIELICEDIGKKTTPYVEKRMLDRTMNLFSLNGKCTGPYNECGNRPGGTPCYHPIISVNDIILAAWIFEGFCPYNVLYITLEKQIRLWIGQDVRRDRKLFDRQQRKAIWKAFGNWLLGRKRQRSRNGCVYRELQKRMQPSLN